MTFEEMSHRGEHELSCEEQFHSDAMNSLCSEYSAQLDRLREHVQYWFNTIDAHPSFSDEQKSTAIGIINKTLSKCMALLSAEYALTDTKINNRLDEIERYRKDVLGLPSVWCPKIPYRIKTQDCAHPDSYDPKVWEALDQRRWLAADNPTAYVSTVARRLLEEQQVEDESEHVKSLDQDADLVALEDLAPSESEIIDFGSGAAERVVDLGDAPLPPQIIEAFRMAHAGRSWPEIAQSLNTDTRHLIQTIHRIMDRLEPAEAHKLLDWINYRKFKPEAFYDELNTKLTKLLPRTASSAGYATPGQNIRLSSEDLATNI